MTRIAYPKKHHAIYFIINYTINIMASCYLFLSFLSFFCTWYDIKEKRYRLWNQWWKTGQEGMSMHGHLVYTTMLSGFIRQYPLPGSVNNERSRNEMKTFFFLWFIIIKKWKDTLFTSKFTCSLYISFKSTISARSSSS